MKLYLVQHGDSLDSDIDPKRPLSDKGKRDIQNLGDFLAKHNLFFSHIIHSRKLRAEQTAKILATAIKFSNPLEVRSCLEPLSEVTEILEELIIINQDILIVGHLPFMSRLVSKLVINDENNSIVTFEPGTIVCLENMQHKKWVIRFMIRSNLLNF